MLNLWIAGSRSSTDETRGDEAAKEDETVVDADQGNSTSCALS